MLFEFICCCYYCGLISAGGIEASMTTVGVKIYYIYLSPIDPGESLQAPVRMRATIYTGSSLPH